MSIPRMWKPSIMFAISEKRLYPDVRNEIVRDLVTHMYGNVDKPDSPSVTKIAKSLVERYPFMADSVTTSGSTAYVSAWSELACQSIRYNIVLIFRVHGCKR